MSLPTESSLRCVRCGGFVSYMNHRIGVRTAVVSYHLPLLTSHIAHRTLHAHDPPTPDPQDPQSTPHIKIQIPHPTPTRMILNRQQADNSRCAWLLGIARSPLSPETTQEPLPSEPAPRSPQRSARAGTHPVSPVTPAKALAAEGGEVEEREKEKTKGSVRRKARGT